MEYKLFKAKTVSEAITDATIEFGITSDMLDYEVIEEGSTGLLGLFSKDAVIKAKPKDIVQEEEAEEYSIKDEFSNAGRVDLKSAGSFKKDSRNDKKKPAKKTAEADKTAGSGKAANLAIKPVQAEGAVAMEKVDLGITSAAAAVKEKPAGEASEVSDKPHRILTGEEAQNQEVNDILKVLFEKLGIEAQVETSIDLDDRTVNVNISGDNTGDIIGKKGQTLDAIQYLISIIVNKKKGDYYRVKVDTNNYRERRQKTLENQAKNVASKVKKTRRKVVMEPMNPYERRIIHSYLQGDKSVTTKSEGEEPNRRVVVYYKKQ